MITDNKDFITVNTAFPRIGEKIAIVWGDYSLTLYINRLIQDSRDGERAGFTKDVSNALVNLMIEHDKLYPQHGLKSNDIWDKTF